MSSPRWLVVEPLRLPYPLESYPVIREFDVMLKALACGEQFWRGSQFFG